MPPRVPVPGVGDLVVGSTVWARIIGLPKSSKKVSLIFNFVDFRVVEPRPGGFSLAGWEALAPLLCSYPTDHRLFCTHVDAKNAFWSFLLPRRFCRSFTFKHHRRSIDRVFHVE